MKQNDKPDSFVSNLWLILLLFYLYFHLFQPKKIKWTIYSVKILYRVIEGRFKTTGSQTGTILPPPIGAQIPEGPMNETVHWEATRVNIYI